MKRCIAFLLVLVMMASALSIGMGISAYADTDKEALDSLLNKITTKKTMYTGEAEPETTETEVAINQSDEIDENKHTSEAEAETPEEESLAAPEQEEKEEGFDQRLVGDWDCHSQSPIDYDCRVVYFEELAYLHGFLFNGEVDSMELDYGEVMAKVGKALALSTKDGRLDYFEKLCEYSEKYPELFDGLMDDEDLEVLRGCSNVEISYEFFDITEKGDENFKPTQYTQLYKKDKNDGLIIKVEADVQTGPLEKKHASWEYRYHKSYSGLGTFEWRLLGEWNDSMGNTWNIQSYIPVLGEDVKYAVPRAVYMLKDSKGKEYVTDSVCWSLGTEKERNLNGYVDFNFKGFDTPKFKVESIGHDEVVLSSESGKLVLTRTAEPSATIGKSIPKTK